MSAPYDLDDIPEAKRYSPQYRKPEEQACVDMIRRMRYATHKQELLPGSKMIPPPEPSVEINVLDEIATLMRSLTYGEMMELAAEIWSSCDGGIEEKDLPAILHKWCITRGKKNADAVSN